jgi:hypothetical protein
VKFLDRLLSWGKPRRRPPVSPYAESVLLKVYQEAYSRGRRDSAWHWAIRLTFLLLAILGFITLMCEVGAFVWTATGGQ